MTEKECGDSSHLTPYNGPWVRRRVPGCGHLVSPQYFQCSLSLFWENQWSSSNDGLTGFLGLELQRYVCKMVPHPPSWKRKDPADKDDRYARSVLSTYCWVTSYLIGGRVDGQWCGNGDLCFDWCATNYSWPVRVFSEIYEHRKILSPHNIVEILWYVYLVTINSLSFIVCRT